MAVAYKPSAMIDDVIAYDPALRAALADNIAAHTRHTCELDGRRHAAVAIVVVDSDAERDGVDDSDVDVIDLSVIPSASRVWTGG